MNKDQLTALKCIVYAQSLSDMLDQLKGTSADKQRIKSRIKGLVTDLDYFINTTYKKSEADSSMFNLIEGCQNAMEDVLKNKLTITE